MLGRQLTTMNESGLMTSSHPTGLNGRQLARSRSRRIPGPASPAADVQLYEADAATSAPPAAGPCELVMTLLEQTSSGSHKFKVRSISMTSAA